MSRLIHTPARNPLGAIVASLTLLMVATLSPRAAALPPDGSKATPIQLKDLDGAMIRSADLAPRSLVLIFGELDNDSTRQACVETLDTLADPRVEQGALVPILIVAKDEEPAKLKEEAARGRFPALILHDPKRDAFGAYHVLVVPSVIVVNPKGTIVHAMPGFVSNFKPILTAAAQVATGKEPASKLAEALDPTASNVAQSPETVRAERLVRLARELTKHELYEMAEARYAEAIALAPALVDAKLGLANLLLRQNRANDAEPLFKSLLTTHPDLAEAQLGLSLVQIDRGGDELAVAEKSVKSVLEKDASNPRAHYLLGRIREKTGDIPGAAGEYRKAAEAALDR